MESTIQRMQCKDNPSTWHCVQNSRSTRELPGTQRYLVVYKEMSLPPFADTYALSRKQTWVMLIISDKIWLDKDRNAEFNTRMNEHAIKISPKSQWILVQTMLKHSGPGWIFVGHPFKISMDSPSKGCWNIRSLGGSVWGFPSKSEWILLQKDVGT